MIPMINGDPRYPVIDGFVYDNSYATDYNYLTLALQGMESARRAGRYRTRWLMCPEDFRTVIPAHDEYAYQFDVTPGSVYWGFSMIPNADTSFGNTFNIWDGCSEESLASEFAVGSDQIQQIFPYPLIVGQPGVLNIRLATLNASGQNQNQLILHGSQPISDEEM